jgi:hypothetical protein
MFQFPGLAPLPRCRGITRDGFPHSDIPGSTLACSSPRLFAACHVLLRRLVPRHPPCALSRLTDAPGPGLLRPGTFPTSHTRKPSLSYWQRLPPPDSADLPRIGTKASPKAHFSLDLDCQKARSTIALKQPWTVKKEKKPRFRETMSG